MANELAMTIAILTVLVNENLSVIVILIVSVIINVST